MHEQIEHWAALKTFQELTPEEQNQVLETMPEEAYGQLRRLLTTAPQLYAQAQAPEHLLGPALQLARTKRHKPLLQQAVSVATLLRWAAVMALFGGLIYHHEKPRAVPVEVKTIRDTLYMRDTVWKTKLVYRYKALPPAHLQENNMPNEPDSQAVSPLIQAFNPPGVSPGSSLEAHPELLDFFVTPDSK